MKFIFLKSGFIQEGRGGPHRFQHEVQEGPAVVDRLLEGTERRDLFAKVANQGEANAFHKSDVSNNGNKNNRYMEKVNIQEKLATFSDYFNPRIVGELNGQHVKAVKLKGEFVWHHHDHEDELFLVIKGKLKMEFREKTVEVNPGEFIIVPHGIEHRPVADEEVEMLLFEPASTLNTGNVENERTRKVLEKI